jgi:hypothetical protein
MTGFPSSERESSMTEPSESIHVSDEQLAAFLDNRVSADEHTTTLAHLAVCADCRSELIALRRVLAPRRTRSRSGVFAVTAVVAAAALAFVAVSRGPQRDLTRVPAVRGDERATQPDRLTSLTVITPADRSTVDSVTVFRWKAVEHEATYRVTLQDEIGTVAWTVAVSDTLVPLPSSVKLTRGRQYFWTVDAQLVDGSTASSGVHRFTIGR